MSAKSNVGRICRSNDYFATQFPRTVRRNKGSPLRGIIIADDGTLLTVKWSHLKMPWRLHRDFLVIEEPKTDHALGSRNGGRPMSGGRPLAAVRARQPVVRKALELFERSGVDRTIITSQAGIYENATTVWRSGRASPNVGHLEAALNVIGYRLEIVPIEETDDAG